MIEETARTFDVDELFREYKRSGDVRALNAVFSIMQPWLFNCIYRMTFDADRADEICQITWIKVASPTSTFDPDKGLLKGYMRTIATNLVLHEYRKPRPIRPDQADDGDEEAMHRDCFVEKTPVYLEAEEHATILQKTIRTLPEKFRIVIIMFYFDEMDVKAIAIELGTNVNNVKTWLSRGRKMLEKKLGAYGLP